MSPKIVADECVDFRIVKKLRASGFEILSVLEECPSISDQKVLELTKAHQAILLTEDSDFGRWIFAHQHKLENQDEVINALFLFLNSRWDRQFPAILYESAIWLLNRYREYILPVLDYYAEEDRQGIAEDYRIFLEALKQSASLSQQLESAFEQVIGQIRNRGFHHIREVVWSFSEIAQQFFGITTTREAAAFFPFQKHLPALQENFRARQHQQRHNDSNMGCCYENMSPNITRTFTANSSCCV